MADSTSELRHRLAAIIGGDTATEDETISRLAGDASTVAVDRDQFVFRTGDACSAFLVLLSGSVRVQLTSASGREVTLYRIGSGSSCVLTTSCLLSHENYPAEAIAETDVRALAIPGTSFQAAMEGSQAFRSFVFRVFSTRLTGVIEKIEELSFTRIDPRLAAVLLELDDNRIEMITHGDLAVELGTAREVVSRHLKRFERKGWVSLGRGRVTTLDRAQLESIADSATE